MSVRREGSRREADLLNLDSAHPQDNVGSNPCHEQEGHHFDILIHRLTEQIEGNRRAWRRRHSGDKLWIEKRKGRRRDCRSYRPSIVDLLLATRTARHHLAVRRSPSFLVSASLHESHPVDSTLIRYIRLQNVSYCQVPGCQTLGVYQTQR